MLHSERSLRLAENAIGGGFLYRPPIEGAAPQRFCGLLDTLKALCYANYSYARAQKIAAQPKSERRATGLTRPWEGRKRGSMVHAQIRTIVNVGKHALHGVHGNHVSELAISLCDQLERNMSIKPVRAEFLDCYEGAKLASAIDIIGVYTDPASGRRSLSLIEVKTGGENHFLHSTGALRGVPKLGHFNNAPRNQAFLQLAFYRQMLADHYPELRIGPCYVAQVRQTDTLFHPLPQDFIDAAPDLRDAVLERRMAGLTRGKTDATAKRRRNAFMRARKRRGGAQPR